MRRAKAQITVCLVAIMMMAVAAAAQTAKRVTVPAGTRILIRTIDPVDSSKQQAGARFTASLETHLMADDRVAAPRGSTVYGRLATVKSAGRMSGGAELSLELTDIVVKGTAYPAITSSFVLRSQGKGSGTATKTLGGVGLGALIGALAGGGKGAAIGAVSGGALGTVMSVATPGKQVVVPSESLLEFRLEQPASFRVGR